MNDFDNNQNMPNGNDPWDPEKKSPETENPETDEKRTEEPIPEKEPERSEPPRIEQPYSEYGSPRNDNSAGMYNGQRPYGNMEPPQKPRKEIRMSRGGLALLVVLCLAVSIFASAGLNAFFSAAETTPQGTNTEETTLGTQSENNETTSSTKKPNETTPSVTAGKTEGVATSTYTQIANECIQSVVIINVTETTISYGQEYTTGGAGSGVIYTEDGYIITNYHVVNEKTKTISVVLHDGSIYEGRYIYGDEYVDLAVIKIEKEDCSYAKIGDFSEMQLGDEVLAIGNPLGYGLSVTNGIISALERQVTIENTTMTLIQTSAAINSGNSGGGLFNMKGELIGIVNAKVGGTSVEGMGFAIPSTTVVKSLNDLKEYGYITGQARLGVTVSQRQYSTWPYMQTYYYIQVSEINENGSAAKSGLQVGDILQKFNGEEITSFTILSQQLTKYKVGDTVTLTVRRPTIEQTENNLAEYLNSCEMVEITITFVEFNPNA